LNKHAKKQRDEPLKKRAPKIVSLGDIAEAVGVSRMAVSLALRNKPKVNAQTRKLIVETAKRLGYAPDPRLAARMSLVRNTKKRERLPIAWLDLNEVPGEWRSISYLAPYFTGARERCEELGYELQEFWVREPGMNAKRISQILFHRGIQGAIVAPPSTKIDLAHIQLNWQSMACVSFGKGIAAPRLPQVTHDYYYNIMLVLKILRRFRYRRIGVVLQRQANRRSAHALQAAAGYFQSVFPNCLTPPCQFDTVDVSRDALITWIQKYRPDVIVGQDFRLVDWAQAAGFQVPEEIGVVHLGLDDDCLDWAGIFSRKRDIGEATANTVISLLQNNQFGLPKTVVDTVVPGFWQMGRTLLVPKPKA